MKMNYFVVGTNKMKSAIEFYDRLFSQAALKKVIASDRMTYWLADGFAFTVAIPFDRNPATKLSVAEIGQRGLRGLQVSEPLN